MKIKNIYKLSMHNVARNKIRTIIYILFITLCIVMLFITSAIAYISHISIDENINSQLRYRQFIVHVNSNHKTSEKIDYMSIFNNISEISDAIINQSSSKNNVTITIDDYKNMDSVVKQLKEKDYFTIIFNSDDIINIPVIKTIKYGSLIMFIVIIILNFIVLCIVLSNSINERINDLAIFKAFGYSNKTLFKIILVESYIFGFISFVFASIISNFSIYTIINPVINAKFKDILIGTKIVINPSMYLLIFVTLLILIFISSLNMVKKIKKISPILLLRN
ncbi:ABC transporter permease [Clostridiisalibacter paucivorans]|uniref:ABC transporter permease n=1 Tax=Clostridiisalibacter paucivorans TaxID=408753 RepID=UPI0004799164|nr:ABC transporter permease [Clostridiisalibacter paucivorans]